MQMPTQYMMAILFCPCDGILNFQNIYYNYWRARRTLKTLDVEPLQQQQADHLQGITTQENGQASPDNVSLQDDVDQQLLPDNQSDDACANTVSSSRYLNSLSAGQ